MTDEQRFALRSRFLADMRVLEAGLKAYAQTPSEETSNAAILLNGLLRGALVSDAFTQSLYSLAYQVPMDVN